MRHTPKTYRTGSLSPWRRLVSMSLLCTGLITLTACNEQELYSGLDERQANEMVAVLRDAGIDAEKQRTDEQFALLAPEADFAQAVRTLSSQGYPRDTYDSIGEVFKREGFVSSPLEERARLLHAMSQEMSNTLANIDGVVTARVHLVVPEKNPLSESSQPASASVFIKHRADRSLSAQVPQIKALVVNSIEGLAYEHVTVALFPAEALRPQRRPEPASTPTLKTSTVAVGGAGFVALLGAGVFWSQTRRRREDHDNTGRSIPTLTGIPGEDQ